MFSLSLLQLYSSGCLHELEGKYRIFCKKRGEPFALPLRGIASLQVLVKSAVEKEDGRILGL